jgi:hypothetical protein
MRDLRTLEQYRLRGETRFGAPGYAFGGTFVIRYIPSGKDLRIIASNGDGWDHVSISLVNRTPTWAEMDFVKRLFFKDDEIAMQLHMPPKDHINCHPNCLHLWRPHQGAIPVPPSIMV